MTGIINTPPIPAVVDRASWQARLDDLRVAGRVVQGRGLGQRQR